MTPEVKCQMFPSKGRAYSVFITCDDGGGGDCDCGSGVCMSVLESIRLN